MAFFCFPNHILKLKVLDQPQSAVEESLFTRDKQERNCFAT